MDRDITILVVDDEQIVLDSVSKHLRKDPFRILTSLDAQQALQIVRDEPVEIILTDLMMPEMDGLELMKEVKAIRPDSFIIMITGYATINTALQATQLGAFDYIAKPFTKAELKGVVNRAAELIAAREKEASKTGNVSEDTSGSGKLFDDTKLSVEYTWLMSLEDGLLLIGVEHSFLNRVGRVQSAVLPKKGDEIRQGATFVQLFSSDLRSHSLLAPLSGNVVEVNEQVADNPSDTLQDPYDKGWLIKLKPSRFREERKLLGL